MKIPNPILTLFNFILLNPPLTLETCVDSVCDVDEPLIRFPFHTEESCGYPGFQVSCSQNNQTLLNLPDCGQLKIQRINYAAQQLWVNDPTNCLPKRLLSLNLSASPYDAVYRQRFTFFNCSSNLDYLHRRYIAIRCLTHAPTYAVFATPSPTVVRHLSSLCVLVGTVSVPVQSPFYDRVLSSELSEDLRLSWDSPACGRCESHGGRCGFKGNDTVELDCYALPSQGISHSHMHRGTGFVVLHCSTALHLQLVENGDP